MKPHNFKWTKEKCQEESLKYESKFEYQKKSGSSYNSAYNNGWLNDICSHMKRPKSYNFKWTKEKCQEEALKYNRRIDFFNENPGVYSKCQKNNWLDDFCSHMISKKLRNYWTKEKCINESLKYKSKIEFSIYSSRAYQLCLQNNWLILCNHLIQGDLYNRCIYAYEFSDNFVYIGLTFNLNVRHSYHMKSGSVYEHIKKTNFQPNKIQLTDYIDVEESKIKEGEYLQIYINDGWNVLNKNKTGGIGTPIKRKFYKQK